VTTIHQAHELRAGSRKVCLAIGVFDGVHLGHQQIIRQTIADARQHDGIAVVVTFDRHPSTIIASDRVPPLIYSLPRKVGTIESLGADALLLLRFNQAFSQQTGEMFIRQLAQDLGAIHSICVGADFVFGHARSGNVALQGAGLNLSQFDREVRFWSFENGFSKPDPHVFRILTARLEARGIRPAETLMVGDRLDNDIEPAQAFGWQTWQLVPVKQNAKSGNWHDLLALLGA
jgi:hypothetical protein